MRKNMRKKNSLRKHIEEYHLLDYIDQVSLSDRNRDIVSRYMTGESQAELARCYKVSRGAVHQVIATYYSNVLKYLFKTGRLTSYSQEVMEQELKQLKNREE